MPLSPRSQRLLQLIVGNAGAMNSPTMIYRGQVDKPKTTIGGETSSIQIATEGRLNDWQRSMISRLTSEDQKRKWPNDTGLDRTPQLIDAGWQWGS